MFFKKKSHTIKIRNFEPLTASSDAVIRKNKLKEEIKNNIKNLEEINPSNKIVIMKVWGELISGKTTEIDFSKIKEELLERGAIDVQIKNKQFTSKEYTITPSRGEGTEEIIKNIFKENMGEVKIKQKELLDDSGFKIAQELLEVLGVPKASDESKTDYQNRIKNSALEILRLDQNVT